MPSSATNSRTPQCVILSEFLLVSLNSMGYVMLSLPEKTNHIWNQYTGHDSKVGRFFLFSLLHVTYSAGPTQTGAWLLKIQHDICISSVKCNLRSTKYIVQHVETSLQYYRPWHTLSSFVHIGAVVGPWQHGHRITPVLGGETVLETPAQMGLKHVEGELMEEEDRKKI